MTKISRTHHRTKTGVIKKNPKKKLYYAVINTNTQGFVKEGFNSRNKKDSIAGAWDRWSDSTDPDVFTESEFIEMSKNIKTMLYMIQSNGYRVEESSEPFEKDDIEDGW